MRRYLPTIGPRSTAGVSSRRDYLAVGGHGRRPAGRDAQHAGDTGAEHVGVHEPDAPAESLQYECQIDAHRRLPNAALTAADGDDMADPGQFLRTGLGRRPRRPRLMCDGVIHGSSYRLVVNTRRRITLFFN